MISNNLNTDDRKFIEEIKSVLSEARSKTVLQVNAIMLNTYYEIGERIVEQEQKGHDVARYGDYLLERLSKTLTETFGKGFSKRSLELIRQFYLTYRNTKSLISQSLTWTHYIRLMRIEDLAERHFY